MGYVLIPLAIVCVGLWAWMQYHIARLALRKNYPLATLFWLQPPMITWFILSRWPDPEPRENRPSVEALTAIMEAKAARLKAERGETRGTDQGIW